MSPLSERKILTLRANVQCVVLLNAINAISKSNRRFFLYLSIFFFHHAPIAYRHMTNGAFVCCQLIARYAPGGRLFIIVHVRRVRAFREENTTTLVTAVAPRIRCDRNVTVEARNEPSPALSAIHFRLFRLFRRFSAVSRPRGNVRTHRSRHVGSRRNADKAQATFHPREGRGR